MLFSLKFLSNKAFQFCIEIGAIGQLHFNRSAPLILSLPYGISATVVTSNSSHRNSLRITELVSGIPDLFLD